MNERNKRYLEIMCRHDNIYKVFFSSSSQLQVIRAGQTIHSYKIHDT